MDTPEFSKKGLTVYVKHNNITKAWRKFKRLLQEEGIPQELRRRQYYEKPSDCRKRKASVARKRWLKRLQEFHDLD